MFPILRKLLLLLLIPGLALAAGTTANLTWVPPTAYSDGSPLPSTDLATYTISFTKGTAAQTIHVAAPATSTTVSVSCGSTQFQISVTTTSTALYPNATSTPSGPVPYASGVVCAPLPPTNLQAQ